MNALRTAILLSVISVGLAGCPLESTNPISTPSSTSIDKRLLGVWHWQGTDKRYQVDMQDNAQIKIAELEQGDEVMLIAHTSRVDDVHYLNVRFGGADNTWSSTYFFRYTFRDKDTIVVSPLTTIAFEKLLLSRKLQGPLAFLADHGVYTITDEPENIARFLTDNEKELFAASESRVLKRIQQASSETQPQYPKTDRRGHVPGRTLEHRTRLDALGWEIFEPKVLGFEYHYSRVKSQELFTRFGEPLVRSVRKVPHRDPHPDYPYFEIITWQFSGMLIEALVYPPSETHPPERVWLRRVEISSPQYALKHGLRVGQPVSSFVSLLGNPNREDDEKIEYLIEDWIELKAHRRHVETYQVRLFLDNNANVQTILFTWESALH